MEISIWLLETSATSPTGSTPTKAAFSSIVTRNLELQVASSFALLDLDGDQNLDLVEINANAPGRIYWNDGNGALFRGCFGIAHGQ